MLTKKSILYELHTMKCHYGLPPPPNANKKKDDKKGAQEQEDTFGPHNCLFCAMESRDPLKVRGFFRQFPQNSEYQNLLVLPLSNLIQHVSGADKGGSTLFYMENECFGAMVKFMKRNDLDFASFYATRIANVITRKSCQESIEESFGKGYGKETFRLIKTLVEVIYDQYTLEKREALLCLSNICKFVSKNQQGPNEKMTKEHAVSKFAETELLEDDALKAIIHCFKFVNEYQFKCELDDYETVSKVSKVAKDFETGYSVIGNNHVDTSKMGKAKYQKDILTRQTISVNEKIIKITIADCLRCLSKAVYWFSKINFTLSENSIRLTRLSKDLFNQMAKLLYETNDYATQCYLIGAFHNFHGLEIINRELVSEVLIDVLKDTIYFDPARLANLDRNVGWKAPVGTLPESGWAPQTKWIQLDGVLEAEYYDTNLNLKKSLRDLLTDEDLSCLPKISSEITRNEPKSVNATVKTHKNQAKVCAVCGSTENLKVCAKCKKVHYCSRDCQVKAWKDHKQSCTP